MPPTLVLADDHHLVRQGIRSLLEKAKFEIVGEAADGLEAIRLAGECHPDVLVLDVSMPTMNGTTAVPEIRKGSPRTKIILLTMHTDEHYILEGLRAGVKGCVSKTQAAEHLILAIREVC